MKHLKQQQKLWQWIWAISNPSMSLPCPRGIMATNSSDTLLQLFLGTCTFESCRSSFLGVATGHQLDTAKPSWNYLVPHSSIYSKINRWKHCHACSTFISCSCSYSYLCLCINVEALFLGWFEWHTYPYIPNILALTINTKIQLVQACPPGWKSEERYLGGCQLCGVKFIVDGPSKTIWLWHSAVK